MARSTYPRPVRVFSFPSSRRRWPVREPLRSRLQLARPAGWVLCPAHNSVAVRSGPRQRQYVGRRRGRLNLNFFCHTPPIRDQERELAWRALLKPYYLELGLDPEAPVAAPSRRPFDAESCALIEEFKPQIVSFNFGLPAKHLLDRVKATRARVVASATTVREARWLESHGCDAIIAMGFEAGGHRGNFLTDDMARQVGTFALVPQVVDAVGVPVIAAGGIAGARGDRRGAHTGCICCPDRYCIFILSGGRGASTASRSTESCYR